jgi:hypothetical protein
MKRTARLLGLFFVLDLGFMGQGIFSLLLSLGGVVAFMLGMLWGLVRGRRDLLRRAALNAGMCVLLGAATLGALRAHAFTAQTRAARVIGACRSYEAKHGRLPEQLRDLVPEFLPSVPRAKYTYMFGEFSYFASPGSHALQYVALPPFGRRLYHFEQDRWSTRD